MCKRDYSGDPEDYHQYGMNQSHYADSKSECIVYEKAHGIIETLISLIYRLNLVSYLIHIRSVPCSG